MTDRSISGEFTVEQKRYLEGFVSGVQAGRAASGLKPVGGDAAAAPASAPRVTGPDADHIKAQDAHKAYGRKLADQETWKRDEHPFDAYARFKSESEAGRYPKPQDNFRWRYFGLFYVAPAQNSYMCRLRVPNGILNHWQFAGVADLADTHGGGYAHVTTRSNLQFREIKAESAPLVVEGLQDLGLTSRGSGADNIRNVTGSPAAGIDPQELIDTRTFAREWHFHVLNDRSLTGLPRKFNVAFDGAGQIAALEETNDIGFQAVAVTEGAPIPAGFYFRLVLGGITGHKDLARDTGVVLEPKHATQVSDAIVRVFIEHGNRGDRNKSRLKYVLDAWGFETFLAAVEEKLGRKLTRLDPKHVASRPQANRLAHVGVHAQKQSGLVWIGVVLPVGRLTTDQMRGLARIAKEFGDGDIRLTPWQNLILSGVKAEAVEAVNARLKEIDLSSDATAIRAGLVACTGNTGCKFAASNTKGTAERIAAHIEQRLALDTPVNIHLTGCHHSCAQHYIGDIGLIAARVPVGDDGDTVEGFHMVVGGGTGANAKIGREIRRDIKAEDCPSAVESLLSGYLAARTGPAETFFEFANRVDTETLQSFLLKSHP